MNRPKVVIGLQRRIFRGEIPGRRTSKKVPQLEAGDALAFLKQLHGTDLVDLPPLKHTSRWYNISCQHRNTEAVGV